MRKGFTLAEVLITLGIIGVVSAMTIPNLISKHQRRTIETRLYKLHSTILQAIRMAQANSDSNFSLDNLAQESVDVNGFSWVKSKAVFDEYFLPVFKVSHSYPSNYASQLKVYSADGSSRVANIDGCSYLVALSDGTILGFVKAGNNEVFYIDVILNHGKKHLISGKDTFFMRYVSDGYGNFSYQPYSQFSNEKLKEYCTSKSARPAAAIYPSAFCTTLIFQNNFKIPTDYPVKI